jgi:hypothetical protein
MAKQHLFLLRKAWQYSVDILSVYLFKGVNHEGSLER